MRLATCFLILALSWSVPVARQRDAAAVLAEMRQTLGGDSTLDAIKTLSFNGTRTQTFAGRGRSVSEEVLLMLS